VVPQPSGGDPVAMTGLTDGAVQVQIGGVAADVTRVTLSLANAQTLPLHPVTVYGHRMFAFAAPAGDSIARLTAYSAHGEIASAVPFAAPGSTALFAAWLKPGQPGAARVSRQIGSGTCLGQSWSVQADVGPWGLCVGGSASSCMAPTAGLGTSVLGWSVGEKIEVGYGTAAAAVTRLVLHRPDGSSVEVRPVTVGGQKLFAFAMKSGPHKLTWTAYNASGGVLTSGTAS
jgi:hypothetical protein